jgi:mannose-6-phosphate isomerase-like protein (cupin superfamily)
MAAEPYLARYSAGMPVLADAARTGGRSAVVVRDLASGATWPWQRAADADLGYLVLAGCLEVRLADRVEVAEPIALAHCPAGTAHRIRALTAVRLAVLVTPGGLEPFLVHGLPAAAADPALFLALAQEHRVEVLPDLLP